MTYRNTGAAEARASIAYHHAGLWCADRQRTLRFYTEGLGLRRGYTFDDMRAVDGRADYPSRPDGCEYVEIGPGQYLEILPGRPESPAQDTPTRGLNHLAFRVADVDGTYERALAAGGRPYALGGDPDRWDGGPRNFVLNGRPEATVRLAFLSGPDGEVIELIQGDLA